MTGYVTQGNIMNRKEVIVISALVLLLVSSFLLTACPKALGPSDQPKKTPESTSLYPVAPEFAIDPQFDDAWYFREDLALVEVDGKCGYVDKTGKFVIDPQFDSFGSFSEGLAQVMFGGKVEDSCEEGRLFSGGKWGYIDKTG
ncbi:MAG: WG repeat-containing protein, partial [Deltaproteobacteria bacterium]|nr:WG repeat-containing protein [Candidatus Zymogenaceae bacterium]